MPEWTEHLRPRLAPLQLSGGREAEIIEELSRGWMSLSGVVNTHILVAHMIETYGTAEQRQHFLPQMAEGELQGGLCLSEADAGSDVQAWRGRRPRAPERPGYQQRPRRPEPESGPPATRPRRS